METEQYWCQIYWCSLE